MCESVRFVFGGKSSPDPGLVDPHSLRVRPSKARVGSCRVCRSIMINGHRWRGSCSPNPTPSRCKLTAVATTAWLPRLHSISS